ncbi:hypothetical protein [Yoonia sp. MH D7]
MFASGRTNTGKDGPLLPFVSTIDCCGAARQTGHWLRVLNPWMVELTHCGLSDL